MSIPVVTARRVIGAGVLAGLCVALSFIAALVLMLGVGIAWQYAFTSRIPVLGDVAWMAIEADLARLPSFLLSWAPAVIGLIVLGAMLAGLQRIGSRLPAPWGARLAPISLTLVIGVAVLWLILGNADAELYRVEATGETLPSLASRRPATWNLVLIMLPVIFGASGGIWAYWTWWERRWRHWLGIAADSADAEPLDAGSSAWFARRQATARWRQQLVALSVVGAAALTLSVAGFDAVRTHVTSGELWATPDAPISAASIPIDGARRLMMVENTYGEGRVQALLRDAAGTIVGGPVDVTFVDSAVRFDRSTLPVDVLASGRYRLEVQHLSGRGGRVGFAMVGGNAAPVTMAAIVVGLAAGTLVAGLSQLFGAVFAARERWAS
jgi:hypothetical protein